MLDFYLNQKVQSCEKIDGLEMEEVQWLSKMGAIKQGTTGMLKDDGPEILPFFDDFELSLAEVESMFARLKEAAKKLQSAPGFSSKSIDKLEKILSKAIENKCGLKAVCD